MSREAVPVDVRALLLSAGAFIGLVESLMSAGTWPEQEQALLALNLQSVNIRAAVITVHADAIRLVDDEGIAGGLLG